MDSKFVNKNKTGIIAALFLVIFLSQYKSYHFLIHTILGRFMLIFLLLAITCSSLLLGIFAVLFIVIMIYQDNQIYLEGFEEKKNEELLDSFKKNIESQKNQNNTMTSSTIAMSTNESFKGREGFNIVDRESQMLKGKNTKEIPIKKTGQENDNVEPSYNVPSSTPSEFN